MSRRGFVDAELVAAQFVEDLLLGLGPRAKMGYYNAAVLFLKSTGRGHRYINIEILRYADRERDIYIHTICPRVIFVGF